MYEPITAEKALNECCLNLLTAIGLEAMYPERADQLRVGVSPVQGTVRTTCGQARDHKNASVRRMSQPSRVL